MKLSAEEIQVLLQLIQQANFNLSVAPKMLSINEKLQKMLEEMEE